MNENAEREEWVLVPRVPTPDMLAMGDEAMVDTIDTDNWLNHCRNAWAAMLAAAPPPPVQGEMTSKNLYSLIYAHTVIKYDPAAGMRCAEVALADAYRAGIEAAAEYHDRKTAKWLKAALKHKRLDGRYSDHEAADVERARRHEQDAITIRALSVLPMPAVLAHTEPTAPPVQGEVKVKPLEWIADGHAGACYADSSVGHYEISKTIVGFSACLFQHEMIFVYEGELRPAIAAAEADHEQRIRSALIEPATAPMGVTAIDRLRKENERLHEAMKNMGDALLDFAKGRDRDSIKREAAHEAAREMRETAARNATSFLVGDPKDGVPIRSPSPHQIADAIRALPLPDLSKQGEG